MLDIFDGAASLGTHHQVGGKSQSRRAARLLAAATFSCHRQTRPNSRRVCAIFRGDTENSRRSKPCAHYRPWGRFSSPPQLLHHMLPDITITSKHQKHNSMTLMSQDVASHQNIKSCSITRQHMMHQCSHHKTAHQHIQIIQTAQTLQK